MKPISKLMIMILVGCLLTFPTAVFMFIDLLIDVQQSSSYDNARPTLERWGVLESIGWNINLDMLVGPGVSR